VDSREAEVGALMAIRPPFAEKILLGEKRVEYRRVAFRRSISWAAIYVTAPWGVVVGWFEVSRVVAESPGRLWRRYEEEGGIGRSEFNSYFRGCTVGVAIEIGRVFALRQPVSLVDLGLGTRPPRSYRYLSSEHLLREHEDAEMREGPARRSSRRRQGGAAVSGSLGRGGGLKPPSSS
jgi:predicted transcriptional regulator